MTEPANNDSVSELKTYQVGAIESAAHRAMRQHKDELLAEYGLTGIEWYIVGAIADSGKDGIRLTDLAVIIGTTLGFLTKTINLLEAKGMVVRQANAKDARSSYIVLHKDYRKTCDEIEAALRTKLRESIYSLITPAELKTYISVMERFSKLS